LATVRIYKVAELLDTTSQEVLALLKRDHGIELKSASSTLEEVVARSFVERVARQRNIALPGGDMFAEHHHSPAKATGGKKPTLVKKAEPTKPAAPQLGPPRLVKTVRPVVHPDEAGAVAAAPAPVVEQVEAPPQPPVVEEVQAPEPVAVVEAPAPEPHTIEAPAPVETPEPVAATPVEEEIAPVSVATEPAEVEKSAPASPAVQPPPPPSGRFVPPTLRLRVEDPNAPPPPARPLAPAKRPAVTQPRMVQAPQAQPASARPATTGAPARPIPAGARPPAGRPGTVRRSDPG